MINKILAGILIFAIITGIALGVWWLIWCLWSWVMPQIWANGPDALIHPSYWLFAAGWVLLAMVGRAIFGTRGA